MLRVLVAVAALNVGSTALASNWVRFAADSAGPVYIDVDRLSTAGNIVSGWEKFNRKPAGYVLDRVHYNCSDSTYTVETEITYSASGSVAGQQDDSGYMYHWHSAAPDSIADSAISFVCKRSAT